jgi:hypothetical protein
MFDAKTRRPEEKISFCASFFALFAASRLYFRLFSITAIALIAGCASNISATSQPSPSSTSSAATTQDSPDWWHLLTLPLHGQQIPSPHSYSVIIPRDDIDLESEMGQIPISAGIASRFYFFRCSCGKVKLVGDFLACDYELNEVLDALRAGKFTVVSISPILQNTRPSLVSIRFQAEGEGDDLIKTLRAALDAVARQHSTTQSDD